MTRRTANDFHSDVLKLFDLHVHGFLDRRRFLDKAAKFVGGAAAAVSVLEALSPRFGEAEQVAKDDARIAAHYVDYASPNGYGSVRAYLAAALFAKGLPESSGKVGAVGFCYGGGIANFLATRIPDLAGSVSFYGPQPTAEETAKIKSLLLLHYAGADDPRAA